MAEFDNRLIPNYIIAGATVGTFLFCCVYALLHADTLISIVTGNDLTNGEALAIGGVGGALITALIVVSKDVYQFFFRASPSE